MTLLMKRKKRSNYTYEDFSEVIDLAIKKQQYKWRLNAVRWFDFEDVEQIKQHEPDHDSSTCPICQKWEKSKKAGLELKIPLSTEDFIKEVTNKQYLDFDFSSSLEKLNFEMEARLKDNHYVAYRMLYFESSSEEDVAKFMGYKISPQKRKLGYRQVKNLKKKFLQVAIEILKEQDIIGDGAE